MSDGGFGDICFDQRPELNFEKLKKADLPVRPLFLSVPDPPFHHSEIVNKGRCLCDRFEAVGIPIQPQGPLDSKYVFVGTYPGEQEVESETLFFSGSPVGNIFDEYLNCLGLVREEVYITNTNFCRAPGSVSPTPEHIWSCASFHKEEFKELTGMEYLFLLGDQAFNTMTGIYGQISSFFGKYFEADIYGRRVKIIPIYHPGFVVRGSLREEVFNILSEIGGG